ncbi:hypothetical protein Tco_0376669 [Tanacetum coccineum]
MSTFLDFLFKVVSKDFTFFTNLSTSFPSVCLVSYNSFSKLVTLVTKDLGMENEVMIKVVNDVGNDVVVNEVVIDMVNDEVVGMWMVLDQQVCDRVQLVVLSLHLDPQLPLPT